MEEAPKRKGSSKNNNNNIVGDEVSEGAVQQHQRK